MSEAEDTDLGQQHSPEEKFFGVRTQIGKNPLTIKTQTLSLRLLTIEVKKIVGLLDQQRLLIQKTMMS